MSFTIKELVGRSRSRNSDGSEETRQYILFGDNDTDTAADATSALLAEAISAEGSVGLFTNTVRITDEVRKHPTLIMFGEAHFSTAAISYPVAPAPVLDETEFSFNAQAPSGWIKFAYPGPPQTVYNDANNNDDPKNLIGVELVDGVKRFGTGVQLSPPAQTFTLSYYPANAKVSSAFTKGLLDYVGSVNEATFTLQGATTFAAGELFITSISGAKRTGEGWKVSIGIAYEKNVNLVFDNLNGGAAIAKKGHYYAWSLDVNKVNGGGDGVDAQPDMLAIAQVWPEKSWSAAIGTLTNGIQTIADVVAWAS